MKTTYSRYIRQIILPNFGFRGQDYLKKAKVLCVGSGGLGSPALIYLASAGIGTIGIIDFDIVSHTNLNRQILFNEKDIGKKKVFCAKKYIYNLNSNIKIKTYDVQLVHRNCFNIFYKYDVILDCTDNLKTKFLINDYAIKLNIPLIHGSVFGYEGYVSIFHKKRFCYRCLYKNFYRIEGICHGILGPVAGIIGSFQALETIKLLLNKKNILSKYKFRLSHGLLVFDFRTLLFRFLKVKRNLKCYVCS